MTWPRCAVCRRPVAELVRIEESWRPEAGLIFEARCHGAEERAEIPAAVLLSLPRSLRPEDVEWGVAFADTR